MADQEQHIVTDIFDNYQDTQRYILQVETKKTRDKLIILAIIIFLSDLLGLALLHAVNPLSLAIIAVVPVVYIGLAFLALKEPMAAMLIALAIILAVWIYIIIMNGAMGIISGWIVKAIIVYLFISGFQHAREAQRVKKELRQ